MGRHSAAPSRRLVPSLVLGLTFVSVGSPLGLLWATQSTTEADAETTFPSLPVIPSKPSSAARLNLATTVKSATSATRSAVSRPKPQIRKQIPISKPAPAVTTQPTRPSVAQRQIQRATTSTTAPRETTSSASATPKPQIRNQTTTSAPSSPTSSTPPTTTTPKATSTAPKAIATTAPAQAPSHSGIVEVARRYVNRGIPYAMGGNSLSGGMDCSHFVWMVLKEAGYNTQYRDSSGLASWTTRTTSPQPGDLVLFRGHAGIFVGNGMMIDQGSAGGAHLSTIKYYDNFIGYGRLPV